ncbi:hypothetical protein EVG20_g5234 [Dentipellis fragilis]|uniref:BHLH domain-containing protein n=1 Tax=Dentipellis fragilis TaxID=205917 RepID=A0A4Y9YW21_9AGAM|nr:hypothetical protein EVG20_g5234 [Dentipellis fragilis]
MFLVDHDAKVRYKLFVEKGNALTYYVKARRRIFVGKLHGRNASTQTGSSVHYLLRHHPDCGLILVMSFTIQNLTLQEVQQMLKLCRKHGHGTPGLEDHFRMLQEQVSRAMSALASDVDLASEKHPLPEVDTIAQCCVHCKALGQTSFQLGIIRVNDEKNITARRSKKQKTDNHSAAKYKKRPQVQWIKVSQQHLGVDASMATLIANMAGKVTSANLATLADGIAREYGTLPDNPNLEKVFFYIDANHCLYIVNGDKRLCRPSGCCELDETSPSGLKFGPITASLLFPTCPGFTAKSKQVNIRRMAQKWSKKHHVMLRSSKYGAALTTRDFSKRNFRKLDSLPHGATSSQVPVMPVPGCSECTRGQTPYYPAVDNWSGYPRQNSDASSVFRFSVDDASQSIPPTPQMASSHEMPAQGGILPGNQDQAQSAEIAELPYQGMPPPPPVDAALSYSSFGSLPQTRLLTSWGDSDHTGSHVPHPHPSAPAVRPYSRTPQSSQMATGPLPVPATPHAGQPRILPAGAHVDVMPEPGRQTATNTVQIPPAPPQPEKRKASASPPSEATRVQVQSGSQKKRAKKGKGKATDPSAEPGDAVEDVPTLPGETLAAAQSRVRREKKRAKRIQDLYDEIAPLIPPSRTNRKLSEDDILRHAKDIVNGVRAHEDDRSKQIGHLMKAKWTAQSELQEERIKSETTEQTLEATRRWGEETLLRLETTIQESESMREGSERLRVERDGAVIQLEEVNGELERTRTQLKTSIEEKRQIEVQARRSADQAKRLTHEKQELYDELQSVKAELQRYRLTVIGCSK